MKGFTLIELMIVMAIVGILMAITLPAYENFKQRQQNCQLYPDREGCIESRQPK